MPVMLDVAVVQARKAFERMRDVAPHQVDGLEYYSTTLWHLKQEVGHVPPLKLLPCR